MGRLTAGRRDATVGRLISTTSLAATVGRLTTNFPREDDAPPVPSAAKSRLGPGTEETNRSWSLIEIRGMSIGISTDSLKLKIGGFSCFK